MQTIAVDFDKVVHGYSKGWDDGTIYDPPVPGAIDGLLSLMRNFAVFIFTSRDIGQVSEWLAPLLPKGMQIVTDRHADIKFWNVADAILVTNRKLPAMFYLDDRAVHFVNWDQALSEIAMRLAQGKQGGPEIAAKASAERACEAISEADTIEIAVLYAIGAASVAWDGGPHGVFQSNVASEIADALLDRIDKEK